MSTKVPKTPTVKNLWENHWLKILTGVAVASFSCGAMVIRFVQEDRLNRTASELKIDHKKEIGILRDEHRKETSEWNEDRLRLKKQVDDLDSKIRRLEERDEGFLVTDTVSLENLKRDVDDAAPPDTEPFGNRTFFARRKTSDWSYEEDGVGQAVFKPFGSQIVQGIVSQLESFPASPVFQWVGGEPKSVIGSNTIQVVYPYIAVQYAPLDNWRQGLVGFWDEEILGVPNKVVLSPIIGVPSDRLVSAMEKLSEEDIAQMLFLFEFLKRQLAAIVDEKVSYRVISFQKKDKALSVLFQTKITDVTIADERFAEYAAMERFVVFPTDRDLFVIHSFSPAGQLQQVDSWLETFVAINNP